MTPSPTSSGNGLPRYDGDGEVTKDRGSRPRGTPLSQYGDDDEAVTQPLLP